MTFHSGKAGTVTVNGNELPITGWSINPTAQMAEFRNSKTGSFSKREPTFKDMTFTIDLDFDFDANPFGSPYNLVPGGNLLVTKLYLNGTAGLFHNIPSSYITGAPQTLQVEGKIVTRVNCVTDGTYALAGGITPP